MVCVRNLLICGRWAILQVCSCLFVDTSRSTHTILVSSVDTHPCFFYSIHHMRFRQEKPSARKHPSVTTTCGCATVRQMARLSSWFSGYSKLVIVLTQETLIQYHPHQQRLLQIFFLPLDNNKSELTTRQKTNIEECRWMSRPVHKRPLET